MTVYGYCRVSTSRQSIAHQERNIITAYPTAKIKKEVYTGTKVVGRTVFNQLLKEVNPNDIIVFDSVSRMSRDANEGFQLYKKLLNDGVELVFLKEPHINTTTFKTALGHKVDLTGHKIADKYIKTTNEVIELIAEEQIRIAFEQSEKEVRDLQQRTKDGLETARLNGKQIGIKKGQKLVTKKSIKAKEIIMKHNKDFSGALNDAETIKLCGISRNSFYKYKKELIEETSKTEHTSR